MGDDGTYTASPAVVFSENQHQPPNPATLRFTLWLLLKVEDASFKNFLYISVLDIREPQNSLLQDSK